MGKSSKDKRDLYYRKAKEEGWRARSAFKLLQLDSQFHLLNPGATSASDTTAAASSSHQQALTRVVDLCAAPGSWSQVLSQRMREEHAAAVAEYSRVKDSSSSSQVHIKAPQEPKIVAVDLQPMAPIEGVTTMQADITHPRTIAAILAHFDGEPADLVVSDGAPDVTGLHDLDEYIQAQLIHSALQVAAAVLRPVDEAPANGGPVDARSGGAFVAKIFRGRDIDLLYDQMGRMFVHVACAKPRSSRASSLEAFIVGLGYRGGQPEALQKQQLDSISSSGSSGGVQNLSTQKFTESVLKGVPSLSVGDSLPLDDVFGSRANAQFIACGDLSAYDSDATYTLAPEELARLSLDPVQAPTAPPYKRALELKRAGLLTKTS
ncbi:uncharacterized protein SAPINGB_P002925 [Magnusiomyces paraingens]|uniref:Putative tRNA (cytidine(32)/guanosine(34)-2'-O)-methyltransferase n=1 Tax=Magnusiomyces paraingens TaxID=2606893 RepID=A0A5E8BQ81_9ASCO|nr:uncharacterized protein SAPINGB_P002925 [Saprochaete ingens]VVT50923.1 unnamed protein product [Saprochaete ingens]